MKQLPFDYLTTPEGILEHLQAYLRRDIGVSDPEHYRTLVRGVQHIIDALRVHAQRQRVNEAS